MTNSDYSYDSELEEILAEVEAGVDETVRISRPRRRAQQKKPGGLAEELYDWVQALVTALLCSILLFVFAGRLIGVKGYSMEHTLENYDRILISNLFYEPKQGDIVVITVKSFSSEPLVKRVIATEGQTVDIDFERGEVMVDGVVLTEGYIAEPTFRKLDLDFPMTVPEGCVFVLGDNRNASTDSRHSSIGMIDKRCVLGKVYAVVLPVSRFGSVS